MRTADDNRPACNASCAMADSSATSFATIAMCTVLLKGWDALNIVLAVCGRLVQQIKGGDAMGQEAADNPAGQERTDLAVGEAGECGQ